MAILKTDAVVLKGWRLGETSKILSLCTKDHGKVKVVAKGGLGPKSKFKGCLEPMTRIRLVFYDKKTRDLQLLSQADILDAHIHIIGDFNRSALGLAQVELVERVLTQDESFPKMYELLCSVLSQLDGGQGFLEGYFWYFESHFIDIMGYKPTWDNCLECNVSLGGEGGFFQPGNGGLLCPGCGSRHGGLRVGGETLEILYWLQRGDLNEAGRLNPNAGQKSSIRKMFDLYFRTHIEGMKPLKSLGLYYEMETD
jgi:DNA repair protein RecO (recombination protein O)